MATKQPRIMCEIDHEETDRRGYPVLVLVCGHSFVPHQTGGKATAQTHRRRQWCWECSQLAAKEAK